MAELRFKSKRGDKGREREKERETETERDRQTAKSVLLTVRSIKTEIQSGTLGFYLCFRIWRQYSEHLV